MNELLIVKTYPDLHNARLELSYLESCGLNPVIMENNQLTSTPKYLQATGVRLAVRKEEYKTAYALLYSDNPESMLEAEQAYYQDQLKDKGMLHTPNDNYGLELLDHAWRSTLISTFLAPVIGHVYSLYVLFKAWSHLKDKENSTETKSKFFISLVLNGGFLYFVYRYFGVN